MPIALNQLVDRICPPHGNRAAIAERVRHWSRSGLLFPVGGHPGKGRPRFFESAAIVDAALLNALADIGFPVLGQEMLPACVQARLVAHEWAQGKHSQWWLELAWVKAGGYSAKYLPYVHEGQPQPRKDAQAAIILNLTSILARVGWKASDEIEEPATGRSIGTAAKQPKLRTKAEKRPRLKRPGGAAMLSRSQITRSGIAK